MQAATEQRWEEAERFFQIVLKDEPESASAYSNIGNVHLSQRRPEQAVEDFSRAIQLAPEVSTSTFSGAQLPTPGKRRHALCTTTCTCPWICQPYIA